METKMLTGWIAKAVHEGSTPEIVEQANTYIDKDKVQILRLGDNEMYGKVSSISNNNVFEVKISLCNGQVNTQSCSCGTAGKCEHMAALLFAVISHRKPSRFSSEFENLGQIGSTSACGDIYKVRQRIDKSLYAVKVVRVRGTVPQDFEKTEGEVRTWAKLSHKNIIAYMASWYEEHSPKTPGVLVQKNSGTKYLYMQMELCDSTMEEWLKVAGDIDFPLRIRMLIEILEALAHIHEKSLVHTDLHTNNILVKLENGEPVIKIGDFGFTTVRISELEAQGKGDEFQACTEGQDIYFASNAAIWLFCNNNDNHRRIFETVDIDKEHVQRYFLNIFQGQTANNNVTISDVVDIIAQMRCHDAKSRPTAREAINRLQIGRAPPGNEGHVPMHVLRSKAVVMTMDNIWVNNGKPQTIIFGILTEGFGERLWESNVQRLRQLFRINDSLLQVKLYPNHLNPGALDERGLRKVAEVIDKINESQNVDFLRIVHIGQGHATAVQKGIEAIISGWNINIEKKRIQFVALGESLYRSMLEICRGFVLKELCHTMQYYQTLDYDIYGNLDTGRRDIQLFARDHQHLNALFSLMSGGNGENRASTSGNVIVEEVDESENEDVQKAILESLKVAPSQDDI